MSDPHASALGQRHARLDRVIDAEARRPGSDDLDLARLKRERLSLKDQLATLRG